MAIALLLMLSTGLGIVGLVIDAFLGPRPHAGDEPRRSWTIGSDLMVVASVGVVLGYTCWAWPFMVEAPDSGAVPVIYDHCALTLALLWIAYALRRARPGWGRVAGSIVLVLGVPLWVCLGLFVGLYFGCGNPAGCIS